jgi:hypothetical protein
VGHSLSLGGCDAACVLSASTAFADGAATALANRVRTPRDLETGQHWVSRFEPVLGGLIVLGNRMTAWGRIELVET